MRSVVGACVQLNYVAVDRVPAVVCNELSNSIKGVRLTS